MGRRGSDADDPSQLRIDWSSGNSASPPANIKTAVSAPSAEPTETRDVAPLVQRLPWDFKTSFPQPPDDAIDNGVLDETDLEPNNLKSLHENYASQCLSVLAARDKVTDARRKGVDPGTGRKPRTHASRERLRKYLAEEPTRLDHTFDVLIDTYSESFGQDAADAFKKAIIAWHAGIEVAAESDKPPTEPPFQPKHARRVSSCLPVPKPLRSSIAAGVFGHDEHGKPIRPSAAEVRSITENEAERMLEMNDTELSVAAIRYAEDFGPKAAAQLERYVRRQQRSKQI
jgi:hypothetical protein